MLHMQTLCKRGCGKMCLNICTGGVLRKELTQCYFPFLTIHHSAIEHELWSTGCSNTAALTQLSDRLAECFWVTNIPQEVAICLCLFPRKKPQAALSHCRTLEVCVPSSMAGSEATCGCWSPYQAEVSGLIVSLDWYQVDFWRHSVLHTSKVKNSVLLYSLGAAVCSWIYQFTVQALVQVMPHSVCSDCFFFLFGSYFVIAELW